MTSPLDDSYLIDGWDLNAVAVRIETAEGLQDTPGLIGEDVAIGGLDGVHDPFGQNSAPRRLLGPGQITFQVWLKGVDPASGLATDTTTAAYYLARWDDLVRRIHRRTVVISHPRADGTTRTAIAHLGAGAIQPAREVSSPWFGRAKLPFVIPTGVWEDGTIVDTGLVTRASGATVDLSGFASATAPCPCTVRLGAGANPALTLNGRVWAWDAVIAAGRQVLHDPSTGLTSQGAGTAWTPGYGPLRIEGAWNRFEVDPSDPSFLATVTTGGGSVPVQISGKRLYRTS